MIKWLNLLPSVQVYVAHYVSSQIGWVIIQFSEVRNTMQPGDSQQYWRSNQTQLQTQQNPPQQTSGQSQESSSQESSSQRNNIPPKGFRNWFRTRSPRTKLGFGLIIIAFMLCMFAVYEYGSSIGVPNSNPTVTNAENTKTDVSPGATSGSTLQHIQNMGSALLGTQLSTFTAKFGQSNDHSSPGQIHLARCKDSNTDQLILAQLSSASSAVPVTSILYASCSTWTVSTAESLCSKFFPVDAVFQKTITIPGSPSHFAAFDKVYYSATLAQEFAAASFKDANKNPVKPGLFDANYLYENNNDTTHIGSCNIQLGMQQTG